MGKKAFWDVEDVICGSVVSHSNNLLFLCYICDGVAACRVLFPRCQTKILWGSVLGRILISKRMRLNNKLSFSWTAFPTITPITSDGWKTTRTEILTFRTVKLLNNTWIPVSESAASVTTANNDVALYKNKYECQKRSKVYSPLARWEVNPKEVSKKKRTVSWCSLEL